MFLSPCDTRGTWKLLRETNSLGVSWGTLTLPSFPSQAIHCLGSSHVGRVRAANHLYALYSWKSDNPVGLQLRHVLVKCPLRWEATDVPYATGAPKSLCACGQRSGPEAQPPWLLLWGRLALGPHADMGQDWVTISERAVPQQKALGTEELCHLGSKGRAGVALVKGCICSHS